MGIVSAKNVTLDDMVDVINDGIITDEFIAMKKSELNNETKELLWNDVKVNAYVEDGMLYVNYEYSTDEEVIAGGVEAIILEDGKTLKSEITYNQYDDYFWEREIELHNLLPLWEIEASDGFEEIKKYVKENYIRKFNTIIDRCYRQEMHVCRTSVSTYGDYVYTSDVELNEEPANYVLKVLKEEKKEQDNDRLMAVLVVIAVIVGIIMLIMKGSEPRPKPIKY